MEIRQLKTFQAIVNDGGFMKAATKLGYAQSTVTGHIQAIEEELGKPLFDRIGKQMVLTEIGKQLLPYANEIIVLMEKAIQLPANKKEMTGTLVIGASESLTTYRLPSVIRTYKAQFPRVQIILKPLTAEDMYEELKRGQLDLAFLMDKLITNEELCTIPLVTEKMALVLSNQQAKRAGKSSKDFLPADEVILYTERGCAYRYFFEKILNTHAYTPNNTLEFWSIEALKQCIICGLGASFLPLVTVKKEWMNHELTCILTKEDRIKTQMIYHKNKWLSPATQAFIKMVEEEAEVWKKA
ncbi:LysR family transcriptional regulator [Sporolactobacillus shoreae]|uniref:LysR family transcriptional regulator n=1 Tax=Sporolactobacillus shoreae TaxID=1465501 RepID=A0A4Z0GPD4_9BACL|nr:LysR family transcriptional regulator [Sporolactobacillus shoreae]TGA98992.1 LysR family transcriptional regulator [Sporolactobacillus shoreae]